MSYSQIAITSIALAVIFDLFIVKRKLLTKKAFWISYAIILPFQLLTNWWLTSREIVSYSPNAIWGPRIASAPFEEIGRAHV